ncbi:MAG: RHS repeat-associated core domain-containing [Bacteroidetes bacterium]|nr:MAG: RHS repeat-associated core domain-containing [Bacteroidota bacterium]
MNNQKTDTITYITSPEGLTAIVVASSNTAGREWYWVFTDHLGSITTLVRNSDGQKYEMSYDAWGNRRDPDTWRTFTSTPEEPLFDRGFTGHEHLYAFNLINMNGRFYDPIIGRMLSPDNFMQAPDYTQSFNRYSYCWNNPLKYIDPTGNELGLIAGNNGYGYYLGYSGGIGPGSGNHWSDQYRSVYGNFMLMSSSNFQSHYNVSSSSYNQIVSNYKDLPRNSSNFQTGPNGTRGFYASNSYANRTGYNEQYHSSNIGFDGTVNESWEVVSKWVSLGDAQSGGGNNPIEYVGAVNDIALATAMGYNALDNGLKRKYAYQLSKHINAKPGNIYQSAKSFGKSSAKVLGKTASVVAVGSIAYDFGTGTANTATLVDAGMLLGGAATVAILGTVAAPFVVGAGVVYGVGCLFGFDDYLNETLDISKSINFINP